MIHTDASTAYWVQLTHQVVRLASPAADGGSASATVAFSTLPTETVLCSAVDFSGRFLAVATDAKVAKVYDSASGGEAPILCVTCQKRPAFLAFLGAAEAGPECLLIADKGGDVLRVALPSTSSGDGRGDAEQILGHLAMLTAIEPINCHADKMRCLATGDADARIRISRLPNAYNIEAFCLGHSGPVLGLSGCLDDCLVSLSADGSLRTWRATDGTELSQLLLDETVCGKGRIPCHLVVSRKHRIAACIAVEIEENKARNVGEETASVLLLCKIGLHPECGITLLGGGSPSDNAGISNENAWIPHSNAGILLGNGRVASCCHDSRTDCLLLLGDNPRCPIEARYISDGAEFLSRGSCHQHPLASWAAEGQNLSSASAAAKLRFQLYLDVMTYARLEASGFQDYLDGKEERIKRLKLKRKRGTACAGPRSGDAASDESRANAEDAAAAQAEEMQLN